MCSLFLGARCYHLVAPLLTASGPGNRPLLVTQVAATTHVRYFIYFDFMSRLYYVYITALIVGDGLLLSLWVELGIGALWGTAITNTNLGKIQPIRVSQSDKPSPKDEEERYRTWNETRFVLIE